MSKPQVTERYAQILAETQSAEPAPAATMERRNAPRVSVVCGDVAVNATFPVTTIDISTTGASFLSEQPFKAGNEISLSVAKVFSLEATVVGCEMEETDSTFMETRYRVRCKFTDETAGMELLVLSKEYETIE